MVLEPAENVILGAVSEHNCVTPTCDPDDDPSNVFRVNGVALDVNTDSRIPSEHPTFLGFEVDLSQGPSLVGVHAAAEGYYSELTNSAAFHTLTLITNGSGTGTVFGAGTYAHGDVATIQAVPAGGSIFAGWSGDPGCEGANIHSLSMDADKTCTATFNSIIPPDTWTLTLSTDGTGSGLVTGDGTYNDGDMPTITATPTGGSTFDGWTGSAGCAGAASHTILMDADKSCTATFTAPVLNDNRVVGFELYNASSDAFLRNLENGGSISLDADCNGSVAGCNIRVVVASEEGATQSVRINLDQGPVPPSGGPSRTEKGAPYFLGGDTTGDVFPLPIGESYIGGGLTIGSHTVNATPFADNTGGGSAGTPGSVTFNVTP